MWLVCNMAEKRASYFDQTGLLTLMVSVLLGSGFVGCAPPRRPADNAVGFIKNEQGEDVPFASIRELTVGGLLNEAMLLAKKSRFRDAEMRLRQARYLEQGNEKLEFNLAVLLNQTGQSDEAQEILQGLLQRRPGYPDYLVVLADSLRIGGNGAEGRKLLREAFNIFKRADNIPRATVVARSIANIDFGLGLEQEALCYSYEALTLSPGSQQFGPHLRMLVALNQIKKAKELLDTSLLTTPGWLQDPLVQHIRGLVLYVLQDYTGALAAEENALNLIESMPELGGEVNAAWWLTKRRAPVDDEESNDEKERFEQMRQEVIDYRDQQNPMLVTWPMTLREDIDTVSAEDSQ